MTAQLAFPLLSSATPSASAGAPASPSGGQHPAADFASLLIATCSAHSAQPSLAQPGAQPGGDRAERGSLDLAGHETRTGRDRDDEEQQRRSPIGTLPEQVLAAALVAPPPALPAGALAPQGASNVAAEPRMDSSTIVLPSGLAQKRLQPSSIDGDVRLAQEPREPHVALAENTTPGDVDAGGSQATAPSAGVDAQSTAHPPATAKQPLPAAAQAVASASEFAVAPPALAPAPVTATAPTPAPTPAPAPAPALAITHPQAPTTAIVPESGHVAPSAPTTKSARAPATPAGRPFVSAGGASPARAPTPGLSPSATPALSRAINAPATAAEADPATAPVQSAAPQAAGAMGHRIPDGPGTSLGVARRAGETVAQPVRERAALSSASTTRGDDQAEFTLDRASADTTRAGEDVGHAPPMVSNLAGDHAKTMTAVTKASALGEAPLAPAGAKLRDALLSAANHAVLRGPATGQIDVPDLGRVMVRAHNVAGAADVDITADRADARVMLRGHVQTIAADLRQADVPVARVTVDRAPGAFDQFAGSSPSFRDGDRQAHDTSRDNPQLAEDDAQAPATDAVSPRRVRIVL